MTAAAGASTGHAAMPLQGSLDTVAFEFGAGWVAHGWAFDPARPEVRLAVEIVDADAVIGTGRAAEFRQDLATAGLGDGALAFRIPIVPQALDRREQRQLSLRRADDGLAITPPKMFRLPQLLGAVERVDGILVIGWACDTTRPEIAVALEMLLDGEIAGRVVADLYRPLATGGGSSSGFEWVLPRRCADGQPHPLSVRFANTEMELENRIVEVLVLPGLITPQAQRLMDRRDFAERYLLALRQDLRREARAPHPAGTGTLTELLLGSLAPAPVPDFLHASKDAGETVGFE